MYMSQSCHIQKATIPAYRFRDARCNRALSQVQCYVLFGPPGHACPPDRPIDAALWSSTCLEYRLRGVQLNLEPMLAQDTRAARSPSCNTRLACWWPQNTAHEAKLFHNHYFTLVLSGRRRPVSGVPSSVKSLPLEEDCRPETRVLAKTVAQIDVFALMLVHQRLS